MGFFTLTLSAGLLCAFLGLIADKVTSDASERFLLAAVYLFMSAAMSVTFTVVDLYGW